MKIVIALLPCILIAGITIHPGCSAQKSRIHENETATGEIQAMYNNRLHRGKTVFIPGPAITPPRNLREWLDALERDSRVTRPLIRIPVVIEFTSPHGTSIAGAWIGGPGAKPGPDTILLRLDDGGMGISLVEVARRQCPGNALSCGIWLDGHWGALVRPAPALDDEEDALPAFAVLGVHGPVTKDEARRPLRAWIEK
ncbi:MAG: hypothetical protein JW838_08160 [Spirochaetes bacterium]|nr:hypothetical protein [Spirochaetota bacterium]